VIQVYAILLSFHILLNWFLLYKWLTHKCPKPPERKAGITSPDQAYRWHIQTVEQLIDEADGGYLH
jgi:hypothetical protein